MTGIIANPIDPYWFWWKQAECLAAMVVEVFCIGQWTVCTFLDLAFMATAQHNPQAGWFSRNKLIVTIPWCLSLDQLLHTIANSYQISVVIISQY